MVKKVRLTSIRVVFNVMLSIANLQFFELFEQVRMSVSSKRHECSCRPSEAEARSEIWKYFAYVADSEGKPTDTMRPRCCIKFIKYRY